MEARNLLDAEFKELVIRKLNDFMGRISELSVNFNKDIGNIKRSSPK